MNIRMDKYTTSEMGKALKKVYKGEMSVSDSVVLAEKEIEEIFINGRSITESLRKQRNVGKIVGKCPVCKLDVSVTERGFACADRACSFRAYTKYKGRDISDEEMMCLLEKGKTELLEGFISTSGEPFSAYLVYKENGIGFEFPAKKEAKADKPKKKETSGAKSTAKAKKTTKTEEVVQDGV
jgi:hypothetical protein